MVEVGRVIRERRRVYGITQARLAARAGTTQAAVSRIERGETSPSVATVERLLFVMGEEAELVVRRMAGDFDPDHLADQRRRPPAERLELAMSWNLLAGQVARAGVMARAVTRRDTPLDATVILRTLADHHVAYVLIGGLAVQFHGHVRTTQDVDLVPEPTPENTERLMAALVALGARPSGSGEAIGKLRLPQSGPLALDTPAGGLDIHVRPPGAPSYDRLRAQAVEVEIAGVSLAVASREDLIAMKRAAGRPIDRGDVIALTEPDGSE